MIQRGDRLPDVRTFLVDGAPFCLSDDAGGLPVIVSVGQPLEQSVSAVVLHVALEGQPTDATSLSLVDDGSIARALTDGLPGIVVAGPDHRVLGAGVHSDAADLVALLPAMSDATLRTSAIPLAIVSDVFPPGLCTRLIAHATGAGFAPSPMLRPGEHGEPILAVDEHAKARLDHHLVDAALQAEVTAALSTRLLPEIVRSFALRPTAFEAPKVVRYDAGQGWFRPHRDNTTPDAAHRRLAVTVNLDAGYTGGDLAFPEMTVDRYRPPAGGAIVFSCSLLHELTPVVAGTRHALLTFVW